MSNTQPVVTAINAFNDNYIWAISSQATNNIALVDPGDAEVCLAHIKKHQAVLSAILITHHHKDHVGGIAQLLEYARSMAWPVTVYGPANENIAQIDVRLKEKDLVNLTDLNCQFTVLDLPGHTKGHIAYHNEAILFCGDTLFSGGCGRVFEGTAKEMHTSLTKLASLPKDTLIYCAHEYTQANVTFALTVEPDNVELQRYAQQVHIKRQQNQATIPSTIGLEREINPFLRSHVNSIKLAANKYSELNASQLTDEDDSNTFSLIRSWKDNF